MDNFEDKAAQAEKIKGIVLASKKDPAAFYPLYLEYVDNVYYYVLSRIRSHQDAEDITAEVFTRAIKQLNRYKEEGNFLAWLLTIARNLTFDHYRNRDNHWLELSDCRRAGRNRLLRTGPRHCRAQHEQGGRSARPAIR